MPEINYDEITSFTPSEILHAHALGILADEGKADNYGASEYVAALDQARLLYSDVYKLANPSAAREERRRIERKLEIERSEP